MPLRDTIRGERTRWLAIVSTASLTLILFLFLFLYLSLSSSLPFPLFFFVSLSLLSSSLFLCLSLLLILIFSYVNLRIWRVFTLASPDCGVPPVSTPFGDDYPFSMKVPGDKLITLHDMMDMQVRLHSARLAAKLTDKCGWHCG